MPPKVWINWSSGKDSAHALYEIQQSGNVEAVGLLCTFTETYDRVTMHAVRRDLVEAQAQAIGLPLHTVEIPSPCSNEEYEARMGEAVNEAQRLGIDCFVFGDVSLEDVRAYREEKLAPTGIEPRFPLWGRPTGELAREMIASGLQARVTCVDLKQLGGCFAGRDFDEAFLNDLPEGVDPCGEGGEFHTFVYGGPIFDRPLDVETGEIVEREGFMFADVKRKRLGRQPF